VLGVRGMLSSLAGNPEQQALIEECWSQRGERASLYSAAQDQA
jgi:hypothetical protein